MPTTKILHHYGFAKAVSDWFLNLFSRRFVKRCLVLLLDLHRIIKMSVPAYDQCLCPLTRRQTQSFWGQKKKKMEDTDKTATKVLEHGDQGAQEDLEAVYSFQLMADVVNKVHTVLNQCVTNTTRPNGMMKGLELGLDAFDLCSEPTFCYFFIDLQPQCRKDPKEECLGSSQKINDNNNNADNKNRTNAGSQSNRCDIKLGKPQRQRNISECSEDSFICFEDDCKDLVAVTYDYDDDEEDEDNDEFNYSSSDDDDVSSSEDEDEELIDSKSSRCDCSKPNLTKGLQKKVRFQLKPEIHIMHTWDFAYRAARKGDWQVHARDHARFQQRIQRLAPILSPVLCSIHRNKVYTDRFTNVN